MPPVQRHLHLRASPVGKPFALFVADLEDGPDVVRAQSPGAREGDLHHQVEPQTGEEALAREVRTSMITSMVTSMFTSINSVFAGGANFAGDRVRSSPQRMIAYCRGHVRGKNEAGSKHGAV